MLPVMVAIIMHLRTFFSGIFIRSLKIGHMIMLRRTIPRTKSNIVSPSGLKIIDVSTKKINDTDTKQHVFGSNQFKDLGHEDIRSKFLIEYKGGSTDVLEKRQRQELTPGMRRLRKDSGIGMVLDPKIHKVNIHESVVKK